VGQERHLPAAADQGGDGALKGEWSSVGIDAPPVGERVGELEGRVAEGAGEHVAEPARGGGARLLDHEPGYGIAGPAPAQPAPAHAGCQGEQRRRLAEPQAPVGGVAAEGAAIQAVLEVPGDQAKEGRGGGGNGDPEPDQGGCRPRQLQGQQHDEGQ
jgi:hypothetical protein